MATANRFAIPAIEPCARESCQKPSVPQFGNYCSAFCRNFDAYESKCDQNAATAGRPYDHRTTLRPGARSASPIRKGPPTQATASEQPPDISVAPVSAIPLAGVPADSARTDYLASAHGVQSPDIAIGSTGAEGEVTKQGEAELRPPTLAPKVP